MKLCWPIAVLMCLTACLATRVGEGLPEEIAYPKDWPSPAARNFAADDCIDLSGTYQSRGESDSTISANFANPIFERNFFSLTGIAAESNLFKVTVSPHEKKLYFTLLSSGHETLVSGLVKVYSKCNKGWILMESIVKGGSGDSPVISESRTTRFYLAEDGSLIINTVQQVLNSRWVVGREKETSSIWYRFFPASPTKENKQ